ncbi:DUF4097 family beta strand repeat-containing protein [Microlunatus parietis]|uniref:Adhesin n=1 Tax=Microlunatus parietis TaxID=682979 RepID=A0A7Y9I6B5_9ACTN|nr:hypothetical protein [Microlunatus parietis]NYE70947.1 hypothetical protein [Microlunatus parietis]
MTTFSTPTPIKAVVQVAGARVVINATDRADTSVRVEPIDPANPKHAQVAERTTVEFSVGELVVKTRKAGAKGGSVAITIDLPAGSSLDYSEAYASLRTTGRLGSTEVNLASGRGQLDRIGDLRASLAAGELEIGQIAGRATVQGGSASVRIGEVGGPVKLIGSSGPVWIGEAAGELDLTNSSGGFEIGRADGSVTAMVGGDAVIKIGRMSQGHAFLTNAAGNIEIGVGADTEVRLERAESTYGTVRNSIRTSAAPAADLVTVDARTRRGDIVIRRAAS